MPKRTYKTWSVQNNITDLFRSSTSLFLFLIVAPAAIRHLYINTRHDRVDLFVILFVLSAWNLYVVISDFIKIFKLCRVIFTGKIECKKYRLISIKKRREKNYYVTKFNYLLCSSYLKSEMKINFTYVNKAKYRWDKYRWITQNVVITLCKPTICHTD